MRDRSNFLALVQHWRFGLLRFPDPEPQFRVFTWNGLRKFAQHLLVDGGPKFQKWHGGVESDIQRSVVGVVKAFEESKRRRCSAVRIHRASPERATIR